MYPTEVPRILQLVFELLKMYAIMREHFLDTTAVLVYFMVLRNISSIFLF